MRILGTVALFALWLVLSASHDIAHVAAGAVLAGVVMWLNPPQPTHSRKISWLAALAYVPWLTVKIFRSAVHVSRLILAPSLPIAPRLLHHRTAFESAGELVVLGNSITLTPGTITVEVAPGELVVHTIDEASCADLLNGVFDAKIARVFPRPEETV